MKKKNKTAVKKLNKVSNKNNLSFRKQFATNKDYIEYVKSKFPIKNGVDYSKIQVSKIGDYSITRPEFAVQITKLILNKVPSAKIITDATAGMGGNTLSFVNFFNKVNSVEYDPFHCEYLKNNVDVYGYSNKVHVYCDNYLKIANDLKQDVIFFDPPWGGKDYMKQKKIDLFLGDENINDVINKMINKTKIIAIKVPNNFDIAKLMKIKSLKGDVHKIRNYKLILITPYSK